MRHPRGSTGIGITSPTAFWQSNEQAALVIEQGYETDLLEQ